jgi:hypothetical protein
MFSGWFADYIMGFLVSLVRIQLRNWRARRCFGWPKVTATIVGVSWQAQYYMPRPDAEIVYTYHIDGGFYGGVDTKPFYLEGAAEKYASRFAKGDNLVIRVKPGNPETSVVLDRDQIKTEEPTTTSRRSR